MTSYRSSDPWRNDLSALSTECLGRDGIANFPSEKLKCFSILTELSCQLDFYRARETYTTQDYCQLGLQQIELAYTFRRRSEVKEGRSLQEQKEFQADRLNWRFRGNLRQEDTIRLSIRT